MTVNSASTHSERAPYLEILGGASAFDAALCALGAENAAGNTSANVHHRPPTVCPWTFARF
jgi:hypothetical protein